MLPLRVFMVLFAAVAWIQAGQRIPLTVSEEAGVARKGELVTSGVPFPRGVLSDSRDARLVDESGRPVPCQVQTTGRWSDGSVKWLLLDFLVDVAPGGSRSLALEMGDVPAPVPLPQSHSVRIEEDTEALWVNTGPLRFSIAKKHFGVFDEAILDANGNGVFEASEAMVAGGLRQSITLARELADVQPRVLPPDEVLAEERGPLHVVIKVTGWIDDGSTNRLIQYLLRIHAVAGSPSVKVEHTVVQLSDGIKMLWIHDLSLLLKPRLTGPVSYSLGGQPMPHRGHFEEGGAVTLTQLSEDDYTVKAPGGRIEHGLRAAGSLELTADNGGVSVANRFFWQQFPKALTVSPNGMRVALHPAESDKPFDMDLGLAKTHELHFRFHGPAPHASHPDSRSSADLAVPLFAVAPRQWYCDSKVFGELRPFDFDRFPDYETLTEASGDMFIKRMATGLRHWGDVYYGGEYKGTNSYMNLEYDVHHNFLCQFARTGLRKYLETAGIMAQHQADIDTNHKTGWQWKHSPRHVEIKAEFGHTFTRGLLETYFLTGNRRCREAALTLGDYFIKMIQNPREMGNERQIGWGLISLLPVYEATWDPRYFNAASNTVERLLQGLDARGKFDIRWDNRIAFFNGIAATGLLYYYRATGDERVADAALRVIRRARGFYPDYAGRTLEALAWAYQRTHEPEYLDCLKLTWESTMEKSISWNVMELGAPTIFTMHALPFVAQTDLIPNPDSLLNLTPDQFSTDNSMQAHHLPNGEADFYFEHTNAPPFHLVLVRKGAWKGGGSATLSTPSGQTVERIEFPNTNALWQRRVIPVPRAGSDSGAWHLALRSTTTVNAKGGSFVTWDVATATPKRAVFSLPNFEGLHQVTPHLYTVPAGASTNVTLNLSGEGEGFKKAVIFNPEGVAVGSMQAFIDLGDKESYQYTATATIPARQTSGLWRISLQDVTLRSLSGLLPYFSTSKESYFPLDQATLRRQRNLGR